MYEQKERNSSIIEKQESMNFQIFKVHFRSLEIQNASFIHRILAQKLDKTPNLIINLEEVDFIDSAGLGVLMMIFNKSKALNGLVIFNEVNPKLYDTFGMVQLTKLIPIVQKR